MKFLSKKRDIAICVSGQFMLAFLMASAFLAGFAVHKCRAVAAPPDIQSLTEGEWSSLYEEAFNKSLEIYDPSKNGWALLNYALFREGNDGVLIGEDHWLFTSEEFQYLPDWEKNYDYNSGFILAVRDYLKQTGTELLIVPVPAKARIYQDKLGRYEFPGYKQHVYGDFVRRMEASGVAVADLLEDFKKKSLPEQLFLKTDTHWSPAGARLAAQVTGNVVAKLYPDVRTEEARFVTVPKGEIPHDGDLLRYVPLGPWTDDLGLYGDKLKQLETVNAMGSKATALQEALFSDNTPPVTLVGTSYSANPAWNFDGFLKESLRSEILNVADEGLGPFETMKKYLDNQAYKDSPPRLVIWEIPERYLTFSYNLKTNFYHKES